MPVLFSSHNIQHILVCKNTKELCDQDKFIWSCKAKGQNTIYSHLLKICLGIPATSMSSLDRCIGISLQYSPKAVVSASYKCSWMSCMSKLREWAGLSKWKWWSCILRWGGQLGIRIQLCGMKKAWYLLIG